MGSFMGHFLPGFFFLIISVWWTYSLLIRYYRARYNRRVDEFSSDASFACRSGRLSRIPIEGLFKVVVTIGASIGEVATAFQDGHWAHLVNAQHISMYAIFCFSGLVDVLYFYQINLPESTNYAIGFLAFLVEGIVFANHLHGRSHMDVMVHTFLLYLIAGCVIAIGLEARYRRSVVVALGRCFFTFLQGSWFIQVGFILYPPLGMAKWDEEDHDQMMIVTAMFSWHFAGIFLVMLAFVFATSRIARRHAPVDTSDARTGIQYQKVELNNFSDGENSGHPSARKANGLNVKDAFALASSEEEV